MKSPLLKKERFKQYKVGVDEIPLPVTLNSRFSFDDVIYITNKINDIESGVIVREFSSKCKADKYSRHFAKYLHSRSYNRYGFRHNFFLFRRGTKVAFIRKDSWVKYFYGDYKEYHIDDLFDVHSKSGRCYVQGSKGLEGDFLNSFIDNVKNNTIRNSQFYVMEFNERRLALNYYTRSQYILLRHKKELPNTHAKLLGNKVVFFNTSYL